MTMFVFVIIILQLIYNPTSIVADEHERRLYEKLLANYSTLVRPAENNKNPVDVSLGMILQQLIDIDEQKQIMQINAWLQFEWYDYQLKWDPKEFGGITDIRLPADKLWKPDVLLYNSVDVNFGSTYPANLVIYNTGTVTWIPPGILKSTCHINIRFFPFDDQSCLLKFGSWTYHGMKLNLTNGDFDISEYVENGEWLLMNATVERNVKYYSCCPEPYIDIQFKLSIKRRTLYYSFNLIVPSLLISFLSLLGFVLPVESNQKITLVAQATPPTSESLPLIGVFFICNMSAVAASVIMNGVVINLYYQESKRLPRWVHNVFISSMLPCLIMMKRFEEPRVGAQKPSTADELEKLVLAHSAAHNNLGGRQPQTNVYNEFRPSEPTLMKILGLLRQHRTRMETHDEAKNVKRQWKYIAAVVDRICLIVFTVIFVTSTLATIFRRG